MRGVLAVLLVGSLVVTGGCRGCARDEPSAAVEAGPPMPVGLLLPAPEGGAEVAVEVEGGAASWRVAHGVKSGSWVELQPARPGDLPSRPTFDRYQDDASFVSFAVVTELHDAFARALPGFDLLLPRLFTPAALERLARELDGYEGRVTGDLLVTARELAGLARTTAARGGGLWVLTD